MIDPLPLPADHAGQAWSEIERLIEEVASLSRTNVGVREFYAALTANAVRALAADAAAVWLLEGETLRLEHQTQLAQTQAVNPDRQAAHQRLLHQAMQHGKSCLLPPPAGASDPALAGMAEEPTDLINPTGHLLVLGPIQGDERPLGIVEIFQRPGASPSACRGYSEVVEVLSELAADFHNQRRLRDLREREQLWNEFDTFAQRVNSSLVLDRTAYTIVNEARRLIGCDRVSLLEVRGRSCRMLAVSGVDTLDRRANSIRTMEQLARRVVAGGEPLWTTGDAAGLPPQIETALNDYLDLVHARTLAVTPLRETFADPDSPGPPRTLGVLAAERFDDESLDDGFRLRVETVGRHSATALDNALTLQRLPLFGLLHWLGRTRWLYRLPLAALAAAALAAAIVALIVIPADFPITGRGEVAPVDKRIVFAARDGQVERLWLTALRSAEATEIDVVAGQKLLDLRDLPLEYEITRVEGERTTAQSRLVSLEKSLLHAPRNSPEAVQRFNEAAAERDELQQTVKRLADQLANLQQQQTQLTVTSPLAGRVVTWKVQELLEARPVQRGQALMTIADLAGPWVVELRIPDKHIGYLLQERARLQKLDPDSDLQLEFMLAADPGVKHRAQVIEIAPASDIPEEDDEPAVRVTAELLDRSLVAALRPGAAVIAQVHCGQRPLGYVWLHDFIETARTWLFF
ncbi:HlyD family efflux transporter periplasmic adaptor subunit [Lignipirellula cremea]|uniref:GAF domain-containing protein n=1 Tax=Lignipirellula cremea TaxID=2528010 RepID=A0A518E0F5_9BACT|nr:HlyD family efflux transporter periplasmic adaptor subunit [Lignipirellula cremea]QDU97574.1 hypothetical protein Pla8534_54240 [Lignipirellula cremea]